MKRLASGLLVALYLVSPQFSKAQEKPLVRYTAFSGFMKCQTHANLGLMARSYSLARPDVSAEVMNTIAPSEGGLQSWFTRGVIANAGVDIHVFTPHNPGSGKKVYTCTADHGDHLVAVEFKGTRVLSGSTQRRMSTVLRQLPTANPEQASLMLRQLYEAMISAQKM